MATTVAPAKDPKHTAAQSVLSDAIKESPVIQSIAKGVDELTAQIADIQVTLSMIAARVFVATEGTAPDSTTPAAGAPVGAPAPKRAGGAGSRAKPAAADKEKIPANSLLFYRQQVANNVEDVRDTITPADLATAEEQVGAKQEKGSTAWWSAIAAAVWAKCLTDKDKASWKARYDTYKTNALSSETSTDVVGLGDTH